MLGWSLNLFRIRGIQLSLHFSFILLPLYWAYQGYQTGGMDCALWSTLLILACFVCVVLHELGHSLTAQRFGIGVRRILLMPIGGMAEFDSIPRQPSRELLITAAGPAVNFALAALIWIAADRSSGLPDNGFLPSSFGEVVWCLLQWNVVMGLFNLVPVFPMDGGRILRAVLATQMSYVQATRWAVMVGKILAVIAVLVAFYLQAYLTAALFAFIFFAGEAEYRSLIRREQQDAHWKQMMEQLHEPPIIEEPPLLK
jgi:Zn-dependent protease